MQAAYAAEVEAVVAQLRNDRLLLPEDADAYISRANA